jgi:thiol:disulfide interchange protein DsbC
MQNIFNSNESTMIQKVSLTLIGLAVAALGLSIGLSVAAKTQAPPTANQKVQAPMSAEESNIAKTFALKFDGTKVKSVSKTPFRDLYEVVLENNEIVYTNAATQFIMAGSLINAEDRRNLTQARQDELNRIDFKTLPLSQSFKLVKGTGQRHIALFEDPNCGYCKQFRMTLEKTNNITLHTFVVDILGPDSTDKAQTLLCATDTAKAWDEWMLYSKMPENTNNCDTSVLQKNKALAIKLGVTGTPTVFLEDGNRLPGAVDLATLEAALIVAEQSKK